MCAKTLREVKTYWKYDYFVGIGDWILKPLMGENAPSSLLIDLSPVEVSTLFNPFGPEQAICVVEFS